MTKTHAASAGRYLLDTSAVLAAGRLLQNALGEDLETLDYAVTRLSEAARSQESGAKRYRAFMFTELKTTKAAQKEKSDRINEDVIASVLADLQVANVLLAAGHAVGEADGKARPDLLEEALNDLDQTGPVIARSLSSSLAKRTTAGRFNFSGSSGVQEKSFESPDAESAVQNFKKVADETLDQLLSGVHEVALSILAALKKLSPGKVVEALDQLGGPIKAVTSMVRRLIGQGIQKMKQAIDDLTRLIGIDAIKRIKDKVEEIWKDSEKGVIVELLGKVLGVETTRTSITAISSDKGFAKEIIDEGSNDVVRLLIPYNNNIQIAKKIVNAINFGSGLLILTPLGGERIALFAASSYLIVLASVILIAMDYADSGRVLQRVRGVGEIAKSLSSS